jgi:serine/threonine protein kinase
MGSDHDHERFVRAERAFEHALQHRGEKRAEVLAHLDASDPDTARLVRTLLSAHDSRPDLADRPSTAQPATLASGFGLGQFEVIRLLGGGSAAEVYEGRRIGPPSQRVALKVLRPGMASPDLLARFDEEREILARMDLPGVAAILDAGSTPDGRPWFAMPFVDGVPLTRYCDEHHLTIDQRLDLLRAVCDAMAHSHRRGIVHRDLTPANILVATTPDGPQPVIVDFGIAKALGRPRRVDSELHIHRKILGTPRYMAPEQTQPASPVGPTADVFSLGTLMTELLCGQAPLEHSVLDSLPVDVLYGCVRGTPRRTPWQIYRSMSEPERAAFAAARSTTAARLQHLLKREPSWIAARAMDLDPDRRYADASELGRDLARLKAGAPLDAGPGTQGYRLRAALHQHRRAVTLALLVVGLLATSTVVSAILALRAQRAEAELATQYADMLALVQLQARDVVGALALVPDTVESRKALLDRSIATLQRLHDQHHSSAEGRRILAAALHSLADVLGDPRQMSLGDSDRCRNTTALAIAAWERVLADSPQDPEPHLMLGLNALRQANLDYQARNPGAHAWYERAVTSFTHYVEAAPLDQPSWNAMLQIAFSARQRTQLLRAASADPPCAACISVVTDAENRLMAMMPVPTDHVQQLWLADILVTLAEAYVFGGSPTDAERLCERAGPIVDASLAVEPGGVRAKLLRTAILRLLARAARHSADYARSIALLRQAATLAKQDAGDVPIWYATPLAMTRVLVLRDLTATLRDSGDLQGALEVAHSTCGMAEDARLMEPASAMSNDYMESAIREALQIVASIMDADTPRHSGVTSAAPQEPAQPSGRSQLVQGDPEMIRQAIAWCDQWLRLNRPQGVPEAVHARRAVTVIEQAERLQAAISELEQRSSE